VRRELSRATSPRAPLAVYGEVTPSEKYHYLISFLPEIYNSRTKCAHAQTLHSIAMGAFHGQLNPLSARSIYDAYVVPVLLFGCEN
jgi:hypothetical protein